MQVGWALLPVFGAPSAKSGQPTTALEQKVGFGLAFCWVARYCTHPDQRPCGADHANSNTKEMRLWPLRRSFSSSVTLSKIMR
jgi:hypothetical protein